jgi:serine phosphatase RsbU (regulator of sigma subunit)
MAEGTAAGQARGPTTPAELVQKIREQLDDRQASEPLAMQLAHAQRMGGLGWGSWNLGTGEASWSDRLFVIFGRSAAAGPILLTELEEHVDPDDLQVLERLLRDVTRGARAKAEFRIRRDGEQRRLSAVLEPVTAADCGTSIVYGVIQDITGRRRAERMIDQSRRQLREARRQAAEEKHLTRTLSDAILPPPGNLIEFAHAHIGVRYLPAEKTAGLGGDWYEASELPDGRALVAIGDVSGHGECAIARMAQLRHALVGLTMTGESPDRLLAWLNDLVWHHHDDSTATALVGYLAPSTGLFTWAQAGHPAPILVSGGSARHLAPPDGVLLGATRELPYRLRSITLRRGDVLLMFTDGLVERRCRDIDEGLALARVAAETVPCDDLNTGLDRLIESVGGPNPEDDTCLLAVAVPG